MSSDYVLFHNPRCSKSRAALDLLTSRGITPHVVRYLDAPLDGNALRQLLGRLDIAPRALLRKTETVYTAIGLDDMRLDDNTLIDAMVTHPVLIERPILVRGERAVIGRPTERLLALLD